MNRRRALQSIAAALPLALSGCVEVILGDRELQIPVPIRVESEASSYHYLEIAARDPETRRETYREEITIRSGETADPPHLTNEPQRLRVVVDPNEDGDLFEEADVDEDTKNVLVRLTDDDLEIEVRRRDEDEEAGG